MFIINIGCYHFYMNLLLSRKYSYVVFEPVHVVRSQLKAITNSPWYDIEVNLAVKVSDDNRFELYPKLSLGIKVLNIPQNTVIIKGRLEQQGKEQSTIYTEVRPGYGILFALYLVLLLVVVKLVNLLVFDGDDFIVPVLLFILFIFLRSVFHFSIGGLKNRFGRIMLVKPEE
jgi:hypothetical protein